VTSGGFKVGLVTDAELKVDLVTDAELKVGHVLDYSDGCWVEGGSSDGC
jgi:hypothetical protein